MTVNTGGPIRGLVARWIMRLEAAGAILRMTFLGVTAASTFTSALALIGLEQFAPFVLVAGLAGTFVFAYTYTEFGVFNRKNREKVDYGTNFAGPTIRIDDEITGLAVFAAVHGREPDDDEREIISNAVDDGWQDYRDGYPIEN